ncbi:MAG: hypothetical protein IPN22_08550 [Bacteroidetes bacterium]|nr:hypothetical protein [Bacteroidota bacterium]
MNDIEIERVGMFVKVKTFLNRKAAQLAATPIIGSTLQPALGTLVQDIMEEDEDASSSISGNTELKRQLRQQVENRAFEVGAAVAAYYTLTVPNPVLREKCDYQRSDLARLRDMILYVKVAKLHEIADPIKSLLAPFGITLTDVDDLGVALSDYFADLENPRDAIGERAASGRQVERLIDQTMELIDTQLDVVMKVYAQRDPELYDYYQNARKIDQTGGGTVADEDEEITIAAGQWLNVPLSPEVMADSRLVVTNLAANTVNIEAGISSIDNGYSGFNELLNPGQQGDRTALAWGYAGPGNRLVLNNTLGAANATVRLKVYF